MEGRSPLTAHRFPPSALSFLLLPSLLLAQYVEDSINVGGWNQSSLVYNSKAGVVYGRCFYGQNVFAIACSTNELVATVPVVRRPIACAYDSIDNKLYCTFYNQGEDSVMVIDGETHTRKSAFPLYGAYLPVWDAVDNRLYVSSFGDDGDFVAVIDCSSDSILTTIPIPGEPIRMSINTIRRKLYVQNDYDMTVSVIDMTTNQVIRNVQVGSWFFCGTYSAAADKYYCNGAAGVAVIDGGSDSLIGQISLPQGYLAKAMVTVDAESLVMVAAYSGGSDSLFTIDALKDSIVSSVRVGSPRALLYSPGSQVVYCANGSTWDNLSVVASDGTRVLSVVSVGDGPISLVTCPEFGKVYVGHGGMTSMVYALRDRVGIAETPGRNRAEPLRPTLLTRAQLQAELHSDPTLSLFDATGRSVAGPKPGVFFVRSPTTTRRVLVVR